MDLFTYLFKKRGHNSSINNDLFGYLLASRKRGTYQTYTGTQINVSDSINARMKNWILGGNSNQNGTPTPDAPIDIHNVIGENNVIENTGRNLYEPLFENRNLNGLTPVLNNDGSVSVSGTITQTWSNICKRQDIYLEAGTYTFSLSQIYTHRVVLRIFKSKQAEDQQETNYENVEIGPGSTKKTFTTTSKIYGWRVYITGLTANTEVDENFKIQVEVGNQATSFEKYKGKNYKVSLSSKNLFNINNCERGYSYNYGTTGNTPTRTESTSRITLAPANAIPVKPSTKYTFNLNNENFDFAIGELQNGKITNNDSGWQNGSITITTKNNTKYIVFNFRKKNDTQYTQITDEQWQDFLSSQAQLEQSEEATQYVPYLNIELCKIGDYQDKIYKSNDKWLLEKNTKSLILDGTQNWSRQNAGLGYLWVFPSDRKTSVYDGYCDTFEVEKTSTTWTTLNYCGWSSTNNFWIREDNQIASTLEEWKQWLSLHNIKIYYVLETPNITEITDENLISQLEELVKARSFEDQTNITQLSEQLPFDLTVDIKTL